MRIVSIALLILLIGNVATAPSCALSNIYVSGIQENVTISSDNLEGPLIMNTILKIILENLGFQVTLTANSVSTWDMTQPIFNAATWVVDGPTKAALASQKIVAIGDTTISRKENIYFVSPFGKRMWDDYKIIVDHYKTMNNDTRVTSQLATLRDFPQVQDISRTLCTADYGCTDGIFVTAPCRTSPLDCPLVLVQTPDLSNSAVQQLLTNVQWPFVAAFVGNSLTTIINGLNATAKPVLFHYFTPSFLLALGGYSFIKLPTFNSSQWRGSGSWNGPIATDFPPTNLAVVATQSALQLPQTNYVMERFKLESDDLIQMMVYRRRNPTVPRDTVVCNYLQTSSAWRNWLKKQRPPLILHAQQFANLVFPDPSGFHGFNGSAIELASKFILGGRIIGDVVGNYSSAADVCNAVLRGDSRLGFVLLASDIPDSHPCLAFTSTVPFRVTGFGVAVNPNAIPLSPIVAFAKAIASLDTLEAGCILICLLLVASHAVWFLERGINSQFPNDYLHGIDDANWWGITTCTTVGYGDKAPTSRLGRVAGGIWMIIGILFVSFFGGIVSSNMTVQLSAQSINSVSDLGNGNKIGIFANTTIPELSGELNGSLSRYGVEINTVCSSVAQCAELLGDGKLNAIVTDLPSLMYEVQVQCNLMAINIVGDEVDPAAAYTAAFVANDQDLEMVLNQLNNLVSGFEGAKYLKKYYGDSQRSCGEFTSTDYTIMIRRAVFGGILAVYFLIYMLILFGTEIPKSKWWRGEEPFSSKVFFDLMTRVNNPYVEPQEKESETDMGKILRELQDIRSLINGGKVDATHHYPNPTKSKNHHPNIESSLFFPDDLQRKNTEIEENRRVISRQKDEIEKLKALVLSQYPASIHSDHQHVVPHLSEERPWTEEPEGPREIATAPYLRANKQNHFY